MITVTVSEAREKLSDLLGKVQHGREDVTIERHGKPVAVMISVEAMAYYEALEDAELAKEVAAIYADPDYDPNDTVPAEQVFAKLLADETLE
jgi:prevent-host-death family protein